MNRLVSKMLAGGMLWLAKNFQRVSLDMAKIEAATAYVKTVKNVRALVMAIIGLLAVVNLLVVGLFSTAIGIVWILPITPFAKALSFLVFSALLFLVAMAVILVVISQKQWMRRSKADSFVREATFKLLHRKHA